jgi:hypothetical protein
MLSKSMIVMAHLAHSFCFCKASLHCPFALVRRNRGEGAPRPLAPSPSRPLALSPVACRNKSLY